MKLFKIIQNTDGSWSPEDAPYRTMFKFGENGVDSALNELFDQVNAIAPDEYTLTKSLQELKDEWFIKIDEKTYTLIRQGFEFEELLFSLSLEAQTRFTAMLIAKSMFTYPMKINSKDDNSFLVLESEDHLVEFVSTGVNYVKTQVDSGTELKDQIRDAVDVSFFDTFSDNR